MVINPIETDVLLVIDVQNDFCSGGALAVTNGEDVVPFINSISERFSHIVLTQDWHPATHSCFASSHADAEPFSTMAMPYGQQTLWPDHCVQGTRGAQFHADLNTAGAEMVIRKGYRPSIDSYSAFFENDQTTPTGLGGYLRERGFIALYCVGLATDFCVRFSAEDAIKLGFSTTVLMSGCRAIDMDGSAQAASEGLRAAGVQLIG